MPDEVSQHAAKSVASDSAMRPSLKTSRRSFLGQAAAVAALPLAKGGALAQATSAPNTFLHLLRMPDRVTAFAQRTQPLPLQRSTDEWHGEGLEVAIKVTKSEVGITVAAPRVELRYLHLRWQMPVAASLLTLGDAWERSYGDLGWQSFLPERVMPWYFATYDGRTLHSYGVKTGGATLCFWQLDREGVSLWLNLSNGGSGVQLGSRSLLAATIVTREGAGHENSVDALHTFCQQMCSRPALSFTPVYGSNDWYYAYGKNSARQTLEDAEWLTRLAGPASVRPFAVIDEGWADGSATFPSMAKLASEVKARQVRPGIWIRPLRATASTDTRLLLPTKRFGEKQERGNELALDPTVPDAHAQAAAKVKQVADWGYELIKHDFSTYDLLGQWGFEMGADPTLPGWSLYDRTRTNAEVILELYRSIREAAGPNRLILGCNTVGHLAQGLFEVSRTGDDTSGRIWERTRRMGVNTLAFRLPQHNAFFVQDADCVGITDAVPWDKNRQWMELLAQSGTALFVSPGDGARDPDRQSAIRDALQMAAAGGMAAQPASWMEERTPASWTVSGRRIAYDWCSPDGAWPFPGDGN